jgi:putative sterol carrier protein
MSKRAVLLLLLPATILAATDRPQTTPQEVFEAMRENFQRQKAMGVHARYQFQISGPAGGLWWIEVNDGTCKFGRGKIESPNLILMVSDKDWVAIANNKLSGLWATLTGRLKLRGDRGLARTLGEMFP